MFHHHTYSSVASSTCSTVRHGPFPTDQLGLVQPVDCLGEGVVVAVTDAPCRRGRAELVDAIRVDDPEVVRPMIGVVDEVIERPVRAPRGHVQRL